MIVITEANLLAYQLRTLISILGTVSSNRNFKIKDLLSSSTMAERKFDIAVWEAFHCKGCPNHQHPTEWYQNHLEKPPKEVASSCAKDLAKQELGEHPTMDQLSAVVSKYGLVFKGQTGAIVSGEGLSYTINVECPNALGGLPGILIFKLKQIQDSQQQATDSPNNSSKS